MSWFAAVELGKRVLACDLQEFAVALAGAVLARNKPMDHLFLEKAWLEKAKTARCEYAAWDDATRFERRRKKDAVWHHDAQVLCQSWSEDEELLVFSRYGGHYFSPVQALSLDSMLATLPNDGEARKVCLAATIVAASKCAAAPDTQRKPFKATASGSKYLQEAWSRDAYQFATVGLRRIAPLSAKVRGRTVVGDANEIAGRLRPTDVVFVDPPYSAVQYSRFYHVLETVARGWCGDVGGTGQVSGSGGTTAVAVQPAREVLGSDRRTAEAVVRTRLQGGSDVPVGRGKAWRRDDALGLQSATVTKRGPNGQ